MQHGMKWGFLIGGAIILAKLFQLLLFQTHVAQPILGCCIAPLAYTAGMYIAVKRRHHDAQGPVTMGQAFFTAWLVVLIGTALVMAYTTLTLALSPTMLEQVKTETLNQINQSFSQFLEDVQPDFEDYIENNFLSFFLLSQVFAFVFYAIIGAIGALIVAAFAQQNAPENYNDDDFLA